jgi:hypothetical protein
MTHPSAAPSAPMSMIRVLLLVLLAVLFVGAVVAVFSAHTGALEKVDLVAVAVLLALAVPRVQRLGNRSAR